MTSKKDIKSIIILKKKLFLDSYFYVPLKVEPDSGFFYVAFWFLTPAYNQGQFPTSGRYLYKTFYKTVVEMRMVLQTFQNSKKI